MMQTQLKLELIQTYCEIRLILIKITGDRIHRLSVIKITDDDITAQIRQ